MAACRRWVLTAHAARGGASSRLQCFLVFSTCLLYLVAAGLFSRAVWSFEQQRWSSIIGGDAAELGVGPGSYDIDRSVFHVNCCSPEVNGGAGWGIANALLGWTNSATYGSVIAYNVYWAVVMACFLAMRYRETRAARGSKDREPRGDRASGSPARGSGLGAVGAA